MKINENFILREVADEYILIPVGEAAARVKGLIKLSESGYFLLNKIKEGLSEKELTDSLLKEYDTEDTETAKVDTKEFLDHMKALKIVED